MSDDPRQPVDPPANADPLDSADPELADAEPEFAVERLRVRRRVVGRRIDKYLHGRFPRISRTMMQKLIKQGDVTINGRAVKCSYEPAANDLVELKVPPPVPTDVLPEEIPLDIIYEDEHMLAINKQIGIICHPSGPAQMGTIANGLAFYAGQNLSHGDDPFRPGIVHRLDKNTSGVMLVAKTDEAHWRLGLQFERRLIQKTYFGICEGVVQLDGDIIDQPLAAHPMIQDRYCIPGFPTREMLFKEAVTQYRVQERFTGFTIVHMFPKTGRTHQLRVHMSAIGNPLLGDTFYGGHFVSEMDLTGAGSTEPLLKFQALHAFRIAFQHPIKETPMELEAPLPERLVRIVELLRAHRARK
ncbi:MAG TPA: RluA family pseudouridine synthase [Phycisphaerae bacterium]|nr:RluA family pseudouridine synthase [Phycisphaerae bacterium]